MELPSFALAAALSAGLASFVALAPSGPVYIAVLLACAVPLAAGLIRPARSVLAALRRHAASPSPHEDDDSYAVARLLYYVGMASITWLAVRYKGVTLSDAVFLVALIVALGGAVTDTRSRWRFPTAFLVGLALFVVGSLISTAISSIEPPASLAVVGRVVYLLTAWFWLGTVVLRTPTHIRRAVGCLVFSAAVCGVWGLGEAAANGFALRAAGLTEHVNDLGSVAAVALGPSLALACLPSRGRAFWLLAAGATGTALVVSGSVTGGAAALAAMVVSLLSPRVARLALLTAVIGVVALGYSATQLTSSPLTRFAEVTDAQVGSGRGTLYSRIDTYRVAWAHVSDDPVIGVGLDPVSNQAYSPVSGETHQVHNLLLGRWYESGILGLIGIAVVLVALLTASWRALKAARGPDQQDLALGLLLGCVAFATVAMADPVLFKRFAFAPAALGFALLASQFRSTRAPTSRAAAQHVSMRARKPLGLCREAHPAQPTARIAR